MGLLALKKGTRLIKYSRKGKPKLCPFRISSAVFRRFLHSDKDYLSFSLLYNNGEHSLDLICKDQVELELWFTGLEALFSTNQRKHSRIDSQSDGILFSDDGGDSVNIGPPYGATLDTTSSISRTLNTNSLVDIYSREPSLNLRRADVEPDRANMQLRSSNGDAGRLSVSSAPSFSSHGSGPDDIESLGDVYVWGEILSDGILPDGATNSLCSKADVLLPKPLESNVVLDVHQIACGVRHAALVTRQGEVFTWGEESGGRLGHGIDNDVSRPRLVESLSVWSMDFVACGEYHTCAISTAGDLFTWGDGVHNIGLLGHATNVSHWIPKRISGPLEGLQVLSVACGTWHTALATSNGKIFTFGDGTFGVLGHGDRESVVHPREVKSLNGLRTIKVACGVWHTAAIVEVMGQIGVNVISRKLFTWGDGDKNRLGHGDKEARLVPTCVSALIDYNFHQLACGHSITVGLTTSGHVFTMGSTIHGQLGNPQSDGRLPCLVQDRLVGELVEEISCGAYHVAVLTSRSEVYTWGSGANGRLGHGDIEDRKTPILVEALKDRHVKSISCGSNFTACICIHKWVSGADQSLCSGCRQAFGFTRKRHNCYNCGLVHCHACSSRKVFKAALAPTPGKPHRVCDSCYSKLKASEAGNTFTINKKNIIPRRSIDSRERSDRIEMRSSKILLSPNAERVKYIDVKSVKNEIKSESLSPIRASQVPSLLQLKDISFPSSLRSLQTALRPIVMSEAPPLANSRPASPYSRKTSPPRSATPVFSKGIIDSLKKTNELLNQEVLKLQAQVKHLRQRCDDQDVALQKSEKKAEEAALLAADESARCTTVVESIMSFDAQLKDMAEKLPPEVSGNLRAMQIQAETLLKTGGSRTSEFPSSLVVDSLENNRTHLTNDEVVDLGDQRIKNARDELESSENAAEGSDQHSSKSAVIDTAREATSHRSTEHGSRCRNDQDREVKEHFDHGVFVVLTQRSNGTKVFKRVKFSKRKFDEHQAEEWWKKNQERVLKKYNHPDHGTPPAVTATASAAEEDATQSSQA